MIKRGYGMKNYTLHLPEGVRDYFGVEATKKQEIQRKIQDVFYTYNYQWIETPSFEYLDVFTLGEESFQKPSLYHLMNRQGEMIALKSDMTRAIARVVCTQNSNQVFPQRYGYITNSFRYPERYQGKLHEFTQAGIELVGINSAQADAEVLAVAIDSLKQVGIEDFTIHVGSAPFLGHTLKELGLSAAEKENVYHAIKQKDVITLRSILEGTGISKQNFSMLMELMQYAGDISVLRKIQEQVESLEAKKALNHLEEVYKMLQAYGMEQYIVFDFSILSYGQYYTGIMFQGYTEGIGSAILEGGRYDTLLGKFGKNIAAVGFGMDINALLQKGKQNESNKNIHFKKTLIVDTPATHQIAYQVATSLRADGMVIEYSFFDNLKDSLDYAKEVGFGGVLAFMQGEEVEVYNLQEGTMQKTTVDRL